MMPELHEWMICSCELLRINAVVPETTDRHGAETKKGLMHTVRDLRIDWRFLLPIDT